MPTGEQAATAIDTLFARARTFDTEAFRDWMGRVERPIRFSLRPFERAVDVESVVQETLLRMWLIATRNLRELEGTDASLRFAIGIARNLARSEARRLGRVQFLPPEELPEHSHDPPLPDPGLRTAIRDCMGRLTAKLRQVLQARLTFGPVRSDRDIARELNMTSNTFLQNVVRARGKMRECLEGRGVALSEILS
jgi:DNA-directed RNA polymerase specialized sigma24 family protein